MFVKKSKRLISVYLALFLAFSPIEFIGQVFGGIESNAENQVTQQVSITEDKFSESYIDGLFDVYGYKDVINKPLPLNNGYTFYRDGGLLKIKIGQSRTSSNGDGINDTLKDSSVTGFINKLVIQKSDEWDLGNNSVSTFISANVNGIEKLQNVEYILITDNKLRTGSFSVTVDASVLPKLKYILVDMKYDSSVSVKNFENGKIICKGVMHSLRLTNCNDCDIICYDDIDDGIDSIYNVTGDSNSDLRIYTNDAVAEYAYASRSTLSGSDINIYLDRYMVCSKTTDLSSYVPLKFISSYDNDNFLHITGNTVNIDSDYSAKISMFKDVVFKDKTTFFIDKASYIPEYGFFNSKNMLCVIDEIDDTKKLRIY